MVPQTVSDFHSDASFFITIKLIHYTTDRPSSTTHGRPKPSKIRLDFSAPKLNDPRYNVPLYRAFLSGFEVPKEPQPAIASAVAYPTTPKAPRAPLAPVARPASATPDNWLPMVRSSPIVVCPTPTRPTQATIASPEVFPTYTVVRPPGIRRPLAPLTLISSPAPTNAPISAPEVPQPQTTPAGANKPTGKAKNRTSAPPKRTTRSQTKASRAQAAKIHGLDASLILGSRLRSSKSSKKR